MNPTTRTLTFKFLPFDATNEELIAFYPGAREIEIHVHHHDSWGYRCYREMPDPTKVKMILGKDGVKLHQITQGHYLVEISDFFNNSWMTTMTKNQLTDLKVIV